MQPIDNVPEQLKNMAVLRFQDWLEVKVPGAWEHNPALREFAFKVDSNELDVSQRKYFARKSRIEWVLKQLQEYKRYNRTRMEDVNDVAAEAREEESNGDAGI